EIINLEKQQIKKGKKKNPSMSLGTSFGLSLKNLFTKKGRTILTSFAGSIGIIGIALIYAVSQGTTNYIDAVQEDTLASYPLTLEAKHVDVGTLLKTFMGKAESQETHENDAVYTKEMIHDLINSINSMEEKENDLAAFKKYIEKECQDENSKSGLHDAVSGLQYTYDLELLAYTIDGNGNILRSDSQELLSELLAKYLNMDVQSLKNARDTMSMGSTNQIMENASRLWQEMLSGQDGSLISPVIKKQYELAYGKWPTKYDEVVLVLDDHNELDDMSLYSLGLRTKEEIEAMMEATLNHEDLDTKLKKWSYEEICQKEFRIILNSDCFALDEISGNYTDLRDTNAGLKYLYDNGLKLKVTGIIRPNEDTSSGMITGAIAYTKLLTEHIVKHADESKAVQAQKKTPTKDIFTGAIFKESTQNKTDSDKAKAFMKYVNDSTPEEKAAIYEKIMCTPSRELVEQTIQSTIGSLSREQMNELMMQNLGTQMSVDMESIQTYLNNMSDEDIKELFSQAIEEQVKQEYAMKVMAQLVYLSDDQKISALEKMLPDSLVSDLANYYDEVLEFSDSTYEDNLKKLGCVDLDDPFSINIFTSTFAGKDVIEDAIADYNAKVDDMEEIEYTDYIGLLLSSITTIINAISYVLIAFVSVSLIVSSIMIGVITLISVQERTKEIGILRAIGASKKNVSSMFNAETVIIGFTSGLFGVVVTYLLCIPINLILHALTNINNLSATLPPLVALILIVISLLLTLIAGIIPSRSAAKKDPVVALRTE
ncbi:MAG: ABC transporter permease, partial [Clostridia bacterium]|nr:ABC transporter permease [Clostridia bacterium]